MQTISLDEAKTRLPDLLLAVASGEEVFITQDDTFSVQLVPRVTKKFRRQFGGAKGRITMSPDFDEPLEDFKEYMQ